MMKLKRLFYLILITSMLACNFVTGMLIPPTAAPTPTVTATVTATFTASPTVTPTPLTPAYIPPNCQNTALATVSPAEAIAQPAPDIQTNPEVLKETQLAIFAKAVDVIEQVYLYPDFNGKDWPAIVAKYQAEVKTGLSTEAFYTAMQAMLQELGDEHSSFQSPIDVAAANAELSGNNEFVGVGIYVLPQIDKGQVTLISVVPYSPAEQGGLKAHDSILAVDDYPIVNNGELYIYLARGPECSATVLTVKSPGEEPRKVMLVRERIQGPSLIEARLAATTDGSRIGYILIPSFFDRTLPGQIETALTNFGPLDGLILDNRMNGGGSSDVVEPILSFFTTGTPGRFLSRTDSRPFIIHANPILNSQDVPLVILVGEDTASFGEIFSGALQDSGRAQIVGQTTLGNVETLHGYDFEDGSRMWIAEEKFVPAISHANWEETGIIPDVEAYADWDTFTFENDPSIAAAIALLGHQ